MNESQVFTNALKLATSAERAAYLDEACAGNPVLRDAVDALLRVHASDPNFLEQPAASLGGTVDVAPGSESPDELSAEPGALEKPGVVLAGRFKLLQQIGEGGMGTVWMAEQMQPVQRKVALKLIKSGMDSRQVLARFEAERQALALMDHPNIAKVLDAGTTGTGRPYFVMELVKGVPITGYCDEHRLTPRQRLELFVPVCQAVQHAHQKGIIHRDLKPSNVMVCQYDGRPVPKIIDFGIAKAAGPRLTEMTLFTELGQVVGTLEYMSPEQAELNQLDIDTRSDIYSLGVLLYELLTGSTPLERKRFQTVAFLEVLRLIREEESPRPSTRLSTSEGLPSIAANRGLEPKKLSGLMRGELDWIVMKTLEKDRNRRYETANGLAMDVQRYLADEAVQACPPSALYQFRKFARRNKARLAITGLSLFFLVFLSGGSGWVMRDRAARQAVLEERAAQALNEAAEQQVQRRWIEALAAARRAEELLASGGSGELREQARQLRADLEMVVQLADIRLQSAAVKDGNYDVALRDPAYAQAFQEYGMDLATGVDGAEAAQRMGAKSIRVELAAALDDWALVCRQTRPKTDTTWKKLLAIARVADPDPWRNQLRDGWERRDVKALAKLAASEKTADLPAPTVDLLGEALADTGAVQAAVDLRRRAQMRYPADFWINHNLALVLLRMQPPHLDEAIGYFRAALALRPQSPGVYVNLGLTCLEMGQLDAAIACYQEAIRIKMDYAEGHCNLGNALRDKGRLDEAVAECREAIRLKMDNPMAHCNLGNALFDKGRLDEAIACYQEAIRLKKDYALAHCNLGAALRDKGRLDEAITCYQEAIRLKKDDALAHSGLGAVWFDKGRPDEAIAECREAIRLKKDYSEAHNNLSIALRGKGQLDEAIAECQEAIRLKKDNAVAHLNLGIAFCAKDRLDEAITCYQEAIRLKNDYALPHYSLGNAFCAKGRLDEGIARYQEAIRLKKDYADAHCNLGAALRAQGRLDEAIVECQEAIRLKKDNVEALCNLGAALRGKGRLDEAIACYQKAIRLKNDYAEAHYSLGNAFRGKGRLDEAIACYQEAIRLKKDYALAHCNLGHALRSQGQFAQALACLRRGHELGSKNPLWPYRSAQWVRDCERLLALDVQLPDILSGKVQAADTAERLALAQLCQAHKKRYVAAARFYAEAFAGEPLLSSDQPSDVRYNAACAAALAGCGHGEDAKSQKEKERARLRIQARDWLRADLAAWRRLLEKGPAKARLVSWPSIRRIKIRSNLCAVRLES